jgi:hypothetical protein
MSGHPNIKKLFLNSAKPQSANAKSLFANKARFATYWPRRYLNVNGSELFDGRLLNHMRFSQASFWFVFTNSCSAFGSTLRKRPASAGTIETIASIISFGSR